MEPKTILVVEDNDIMGTFLEKVVGIIGHVPVFASCVTNAIAILEEKDVAVDAILSDVDLEENATGYDLFDWVIVNRPELRSKFAFMTGRYPSEKIRKAIEDSARPVLDKPFTVSKLRELLADLLVEE